MAKNHWVFWELEGKERGTIAILTPTSFQALCVPMIFYINYNPKK